MSINVTILDPFEEGSDVGVSSQFIKDLAAIAIDLDGTVLRKDTSMTERTRDALVACASSGIPVLLSTGRSPEASESYRSSLGITGPMVFYNGAAVVDAPKGEFLASSLVSGDVVAACVSIARSHDLHFHGFLSDGRLVYERQRPEVDIYHQRTGLVGTVVDFDEMAREAGKDGVELIKGMFIAPPEVLGPVEKELDLRFGERIYHARSHSNFLEVMTAGVSKGAALSVALSLRGIDMGRVAAFGDGENDIPMIEAAGWGVAMGNAVPSLRAAADEIIGSVEEDAVALWIEAALSLRREASREG